MQPKRSTGKELSMLRGLILGSILLLLVFLAYWLRSRYQTERTSLEKDLIVKLEATRQDISDSLLMIKVLSAQTVSNGTKNFRIAGVHPSSIQIRMSSETQSRTLQSLAPKGQVKMMGQKQELFLHPSGDTLPKILIRSIGSMIEKTGVFSDSMHVLLTVGDSITVQRTFQKKLLAEGYNFIVGKENKLARADLLGVVPILLKEPSRQPIAIYGYRPFLLRKILSDILFSLLLLGITSGAFWLTIRALRQQMRLSLIRNELVSNMSHELKTPVATVKVALEALRDEAVRTDPCTLRDYVGIASLEISRLELLINKTLHTSLLEEGRLLMQMQAVNVLRLVEELTNTIKVRFTQQSASITMQIEGQNFTAQADKLHLQGVLLNVLDNSLKYCGAGVEVQMIVKELAAEVEITVADNGPGIPPSYVGQVFDKFFRVPANNLHNVKGYGLGLNYASQVMQQHSGSIRVANNADAGCSFIISLPKSTVREV